MMTDPIHIVTSFDAIGGPEAQARALADRLSALAPTQLWSLRPSRATAHYRAQPISPFGGQMPRGGTLILVGTHFEPGVWLDYVKPKRLIVICNRPSIGQTMAFLTWLERPSLPPAELAFVSKGLKAIMALPGRLCPPLIDLERFHPARRTAGQCFRVGRHARDEAAQHHPDDPSLYKMLCWNGIAVRLLGATVLAPSLAETPNLQLLPADAEVPENFLGSLDLFLYRPASRFPDAGATDLIEAMACGLPVIARADGRHSEWIDHDDCGYLFVSQEEAYEQVIALSKSPEKQKALGLAARQRAERLGGDQPVRDYLDWLCGGLPQ